MTGDAEDMLARLRAGLPQHWFADAPGLLDALLRGLGAVWAWAWELLAAVRVQARIATALGDTLELIAVDCFGSRVRRRIGQGDASFRFTILRELLRERATRSALASVLLDLTGRAPRIFEPRRPADTSGWGVGGGWGVAGGWGSLLLPCQVFVTAYRPVGSGIAGLDGWGGGGGGYGVGAVAWASLAMFQGNVTDADIETAVVSVLPAGVTAWMRIES